MSILVYSHFSEETESTKAGREIAEYMQEHFGNEKISALLVYATVNHVQPEVLKTIQEVLGREVNLIGCSTSGIVTNQRVIDRGYLVGAMGMGGSLTSGAFLEEEIQVDTFEKGKSLGKKLKTNLDQEPKGVILIYDPLSGVDVQVLLNGLNSEVDYPIIGGAAGQPWGRMIQTFQYHGDRVMSKAAVALALCGPFEAEFDASHGTTPTGVESKVTRADGNLLLELDGRPALDVMKEMTGCTERTPTADDASSWAIGVLESGKTWKESFSYVVRAVFGFDFERKGVVLQAGIPEGTTIMFHHRTEEGVLSGTEQMGRNLSARIKGRSVKGAIGFECIARVTPFLGEDGSLKENTLLQDLVGPAAPWLGLLAWGEIVPYGNKPTFHNYTYPLMVLVE